MAQSVRCLLAKHELSPQNIEKKKISRDHTVLPYPWCWGGVDKGVLASQTSQPSLVDKLHVTEEEKKMEERDRERQGDR